MYAFYVCITTSCFTNCQSSGISGVSHDQNNKLQCIVPWMCTWTVWALRGRA